MTTETEGIIEAENSEGQAGRPLLTLFAVPKAFTGVFDEIQRNAVDSWRALGPACQVILIGDDPGVAEAARELEVEHEPSVRRNALGTPLLDDVFARARARAEGELLAYVNCDLVLQRDFLDAARLLQERDGPFLMVGECLNVESLDPGVPRVRRGRDALDFFVFSPGLFESVPPFAIGRTGFDNWLLWSARDSGAALIDVSADVTVLHQDHDYSHLSDGKSDAYHGPETRDNWRLAGGKRHFFSLLDATHVLRGGRVHRRWASVLRAETRARAIGWYARRLFEKLSQRKPCK